MSKAGFSDANVVGAEFNLTPPAPVDGQRLPLQTDAAGNLLVNPSGVTQPVSGTVTAKIEGQAGTSLETTPGVVDTNLKNVGNNPVVQAAAGIPKVGAVGNTGAALDGPAGTPSSQAVTVQGNTGGTPLPVTGSVNVFPGPSDWPTNITKVGGSAVSLGAKASASSIPVVLATDEAALNVIQPTAANLNATVVGSVVKNSPVTWNSSTVQGTNYQVNTAGYGSATVQIQTSSGTFSAGQIEFRGNVSGSGDTGSIVGMRVPKFGEQSYDAAGEINLAPNQSYMYQFNVAGMDSILIDLATAITGTGTVTTTVEVAQPSAPGPTTVGQSDATKLNSTVTTIGTQAATASSAATWNSGTANNSSVTLIIPPGINTVGVTIHTDGGTFTGGQVEFLASAPGGNAGTALTGMRQGTFANQLYDATDHHTFVSNTDVNYWFPVGGMFRFVVFLTSVITGTGNVTITVQGFTGTMPGPTTVGQSDYTKHNVTFNYPQGSFVTKIVNGASGANAALSVPAGKKWIVKSGSILFTTGGTAGNRNVQIFVNDASANTIFQSLVLASATTLFAQTASQNFRYNFAPAFPYFQTTPLNGNMSFPFPEVMMGPGFTISTNLVGLAAGDSAIVALNVIELSD